MISCIVGDFGMGKTTLLKSFIKKAEIHGKDRLAYAVIKKDMGNVEYEGSVLNYVNIATRKKDTLFLIDEASTFLPKKQPEPLKRKFDDDLIKWLINARKCNNMVFFVFHALEEVPHWLIKYLTYFIRFNTQDMLKFQKMRFSDFPKIVQSLTENPSIPKYEYDQVQLRSV